MAGFTQKTINYINAILGRREAKGRIAELRYNLVISGMPEDLFTVIGFKSRGALNQIYQLEVSLVSKEDRLDLHKSLLSPVFGFTQRGKESFIPNHWILAELEQQHKAGEYTFFRGVVVPKLWFLTLTKHNQVFLDKTIPEILEEVLIDGGLQKDEFEFRLQGDYSRRWEYVCQFRESNYSFLCRWLEHQGMYFFFETADNVDKVIITDTKIAHAPSSLGCTLKYHPPSGLEELDRDDLLISFSCRHQRLPKSVTMKDYNYRVPSMDLVSQAEVIEDGQGEVYIYGDHFQTREESVHLAKIRSEELRGRQVTFYGQSNASFLRAGAVFQVEGHYRDDYNGSYLVTSIEQEGDQSFLIFPGVNQRTGKHESKPYYRNSFTAIPLDVQYRPPLITEKPRFHGVINAKIDAEGAGSYPELDDHGRYKVILPFDLSSRKGGKASAWVRMAQPYVGGDHGLHFPLRKGTEVLLAFIDGDPDRPIIAAAVPNPETPSVINQQTATKAGFSTPGGGALVAENTQGHERLTLSQGNDSMISVSGGALGSENINYGQYICNYAPQAMLAIGSIFSFDYSLFSTLKVTGHKSNWAGILGLLNKGVGKIPSSLFDKGGFFGGVMRQLVPAVLLVLEATTGSIVSNIVKNRINAKLPGIPKLGYGLFAEENGVSEVTKTDGSDIALISTTGTIDLGAGTNINLSARDCVLNASRVIRANSEDGTYISSKTSISLRTETDDIRLWTDQGRISLTANRNSTIIETTDGDIVIETHRSGGVRIGQKESNSQGTTSINSNKTVTLNVLNSNITIENDQITISNPSKITFKVGSNEIVVSPDNIEIKAAQKVQINDLTIDKKQMSFKGSAVNLADTIKVI